jgi:GT2 family glycosyltransferase
LFLNPDTLIPCGALEALLQESSRREEMHLLSLRQVDAGGRAENTARLFPSVWTVNALIRPFYQMIRMPGRRMRCRGEKIIHPDWVSGSLVWMSRDTFRQLGGWDEDYWLYYEDVDLCRRLQEQGGEVAMLCEPAVIHRHGGTTRQEKRKVAFFKTYVLISQHIYFRKHYPGAGGSLLLFFLVANNLLFEQLLPALAGLLLFPAGVVRRHLFIYIYLVKYYFRALALRRWNIDPEELPFGKGV